MCSVKDSDLCFRAGEACLPTKIFEDTGLASAPHAGPSEAKKRSKDCLILPYPAHCLYLPNCLHPGAGAGHSFYVTLWALS